MLDTCFVSEIASRKADPQVLAWAREQDSSDQFISVVTLGEIRKGIAQMKPGRRKVELDHWLGCDLMVQFAERVLPLDLPTMLWWGQRVGELRAVGRTPPIIDSLIAASAAARGLSVVTRNEADFRAMGVPVINPWSY